MTAALEDIRAAKSTGDASVSQTSEPVDLVGSFVLSVLYKNYPFKDATDIEDIAQEVWVRVWKNIESYDATRSGQSWLAAITMRTAVDSWRREGRGRLCVLSGNRGSEALATFDFLADDSKTDPAEIFFDAEQARERSSATRRALERLTAGQRDAIELDLQEMSTAAIAQTLGIPEGTVKSRLHAGKVRLRELLQGI